MLTVYVETTVISYLTSRPSPNLTIASRQWMTREWWNDYANWFEPVISSLVLREISQGDSETAQKRRELVSTIRVLEVSEESLTLSRQLVEAEAVPPVAERDALHIALAVCHQIQYLVSWNFKHIVNPTKQQLIAQVCQKANYQPVIICTPEELVEINHDMERPYR